MIKKTSQKTSSGLEKSNMKKDIRHFRSFTAFFILLGVTALLCFASYRHFPFLFGFRSAQPHIPIALTAISPVSINKPVRITRTGSIQNAATVPVNAEFSGVLSELYVSEGQTVQAGQPLFKLQGTSKPVEAEREEVSMPSTSSYDSALKEYNRLQKLYEVGAIPRRQMDAAAARLQDAKENLESAKSVPALPRSVSNGSVTTTASVSGMVSGLSAAAGKTVQAGQPLLSIGSGQDVEAVISISQNDLYLVHLGTAVLVEAAEQQIPGQVSAIYPIPQDNETSLFMAHVKLSTNPQGLLTPAMPVNALIDTGQTSSVPALPAASVFQDDQGQKAIFLAVNGIACLQPVTTGEVMGALVEITSVLPPQSLVITSNIQELKNGDAVIVTEEKTE